MKANQEIREKAQMSHIALWQIAHHIGVSEPTMIRWLRIPLSAEREQRIMDAISALEKEAQNEQTAAD